MPQCVVLQPSLDYTYHESPASHSLHEGRAKSALLFSWGRGLTRQMVERGEERRGALLRAAAFFCKTRSLPTHRVFV
jgi:hypothetical protein